MSTYNSQYMGNQQFQHPEDKAVVTIINPAAERETFYEENHDYHEPFEMNAARALPHLPRPITPRPTTITNVHYGVPGGMGSTLPPEPTSPHYQDPDELASVSEGGESRPLPKFDYYKYNEPTLCTRSISDRVHGMVVCVHSASQGVLWGHGVMGCSSRLASSPGPPFIFYFKVMMMYLNMHH